MTLQVLTPIFPPEVKPVRDGWYLTRHFGGSLVWALVEWNEFSWVCPIKDRRITQHRHWRGLAFDPDAAESERRVLSDDEGQYARTQSGVFLPGAELYAPDA